MSDEKPPPLPKRTPGKAAKKLDKAVKKAMKPSKPSKQKPDNK